ncbi:trypsin-like peptidase domain-containing protein [Georgenia sp. MJ206]|uniref:S1C family serine protease n=1 Tax=Georgenia wangjunii TaxID=3117730 RepID=UPI002F263BB4
MTNENLDPQHGAPAEPVHSDVPGAPQGEAAAHWARQVREGATQKSQWVDPGIGAALAFGTAPADYPERATFDALAETVSDAPPVPAPAEAAEPERGSDALASTPPVGATDGAAANDRREGDASSTPSAGYALPAAPQTPQTCHAFPGAPQSGHALPAAAQAGNAFAPVPAGAFGPTHETTTATIPAPPRRSGRRGWASLGGTAAAAALLASLGTASLTGAFDEQPALIASSSSEQVVNAAPVSSTSDDPDWEAVAAAVRESVVALDVTTTSGQGAGSGVLLDADGHVLTNNHVVDGARPGGIVVSLSDARMYEAEIVGTDPTTDLAVVRLVDPPKDLVPATFGTSGDLAVGEAVVAVGNPLGLSSTVTTGIVSALDRPVTTAASDPRSGTVVTNAIQVDAAINPGNSGGPLFDASGRVIGITSSIATLSGGSAAGSIGLGFAIPVDQASDVAEQLIKDGTAEHAFLGVSLADATATADGATRPGALVQRIEAGAPADAAGLREGDVVTAIDDRPVGSAASLTGYVRQYAAGESVTLTVVRDGMSDDVDVTLAAREQIGA